MATYNRNWLKSEIKGWLKDDSIDPYMDTWIDLGAKRVSQLLECFEMEAIITNNLSVAINEIGADGGYSESLQRYFIDGGDAFSQPELVEKDYMDFPADYKRLVGVQVSDLGNGEWRNLKSVPKHEAAMYKSAGHPLVYILERRQIRPLPFMAGAYRAIYLREVIVPLGDVEDDVLTAYPMIFLNAALAEGADWKQDVEMQQRFESKWVEEAEQAKVVYRSEHGGDTPAMRAV